MPTAVAVSYPGCRVLVDRRFDRAACMKLPGLSVLENLVFPHCMSLWIKYESFPSVLYAPLLLFVVFMFLLSHGGSVPASKRMAWWQNVTVNGSEAVPDFVDGRSFHFNISSRSSSALSADQSCTRRLDRFVIKVSTRSFWSTCLLLSWLDSCNVFSDAYTFHLAPSLGLICPVLWFMMKNLKTSQCVLVLNSN